MTTLIDLRSDTVTLPPPEMRQAMYEAELGDDVFGDDPTVNRLQEHTATLAGTEDALFVASGTMGNLVAILTHTRRGDEVIMGDQAHIFRYEGGGTAVLGAASLYTVPNAADGTLPLPLLRAAVRDSRDVHQPRTRLICLENTHNRCGGTVLEPAYMQAVGELAADTGVPLHLDGARLFNAAVHLDLPLRELVRPADSVNLCFSKGLAAPVGSILCGRREFIAEARRWRKIVGGGMRQAGVLAAAALWALENMFERLADDHANARFLAEGLAELPGLQLAQSEVQTNIVVVDIAATGLTVPEFVARAKEAGVLCVAFGQTQIRFVTHYGIARRDIDAALTRIKSIMADEGNRL